MPTPTWVIWSSKITALILVIFTSLAAATLTAILVQIGKGYYNLELALYAIVYLIVFGAGIFYMVRLARAGPPANVDLREPKLSERPARPLSGAEADA